ncbi:hypothetical protein FOZ61_005189 [Perkinsus olseni]|uniref:Uncharacterized protein n=1 Tax=Perkinsus olseni TaxID=32597 RepID=A0A7J6MRY6_PEROL|nr:hypothetical protein FOZ61_005189 [Perkinsus olseni]KAF4674333.1 hypothetical protein FOL46_005307 [Perkinsus olseni]
MQIHLVAWKRIPPHAIMHPIAFLLGFVSVSLCEASLAVEPREYSCVRYSSCFVSIPATGGTSSDQLFLTTVSNDSCATASAASIAESGFASTTVSPTNVTATWLGYDLGSSFHSTEYVLNLCIGSTNVGNLSLIGPNLAAPPTVTCVASRDCYIHVNSSYGLQAGRDAVRFVQVEDSTQCNAPNSGYNCSQSPTSRAVHQGLPLTVTALPTLTIPAGSLESAGIFCACYCAGDLCTSRLDKYSALVGTLVVEGVATKSPVPFSYSLAIGLANNITEGLIPHFAQLLGSAATASLQGLSSINSITLDRIGIGSPEDDLEIVLHLTGVAADPIAAELDLHPPIGQALASRRLQEALISNNTILSIIGSDNSISVTAESLEWNKHRCAQSVATNCSTTLQGVGLSPLDRVQLISLDAQCGTSPALALPRSSITVSTGRDEGTVNWGPARARGKYKQCYCRANVTACDADADFLQDIGVLEIRGPAEQGPVVCSLDSVSCVLGPFGGLGLSRTDRVLLTPGSSCPGPSNLTFSTVSEIITVGRFGRAQLHPGSPVVTAAGGNVTTWAVCYCATVQSAGYACSMPQDFSFKVQDLTIIKFPAGPLLQVTCTAGAECNVVVGYRYSEGDMVGLLPNPDNATARLCGRAHLSVKFFIDPDLVGRLPAGSSVPGGDYALCYCPEMHGGTGCINDDTKFSEAIGDLTMRGPRAVHSNTQHLLAGVMVNLSLVSTQLQLFPQSQLQAFDDVDGTIATADFLNLADGYPFENVTPLRGGRFRLFWGHSPDYCCPVAIEGVIEVSGPTTSDLEFSCVAGIPCNLYGEPVYSWGTNDTVYLSPHGCSPTEASNAHHTLLEPITRAGQYAAIVGPEASNAHGGGVYSICYCPLGSCGIASAGSVSMVGPSTMSLSSVNGSGLGFAGSSLILALEGLGLRAADDAIAIVPQGAACGICIRSDAVESLRPIINEQSNVNFSSYNLSLNSGGPFDVCWCFNHTGGCADPYFKVPRTVRVIGPQQTRVFDEDLSDDRLLVGRNITVVLDGYNLTVADRIVILFGRDTTCGAASESSSFVRTPNVSSPEGRSNSTQPWGPIEFLYGGSYVICWCAGGTGECDQPALFATEVARINVHGPSPLGTDIGRFPAGVMRNLTVSGYQLDSNARIRVVRGGSAACSALGANSSHSALLQGPLAASPQLSGGPGPSFLRWPVALATGGLYSVCYCGGGSSVDNATGDPCLASGFFDTYLGSFNVSGPAQDDALVVCAQNIDCLLGPIQGTYLAVGDKIMVIHPNDACGSNTAHSEDFVIEVDADLRATIGAHLLAHPNQHVLCYCVGAFGGGGPCQNKTDFVSKLGNLVVSGVLNGTGHELDVMSTRQFDLEVSSIDQDQWSTIYFDDSASNCATRNGSFISRYVSGPMNTSVEGGLSVPGSLPESRTWQGVTITMGGIYTICWGNHSSLNGTAVARVAVAGASNISIVDLKTKMDTRVLIEQEVFSLEILGTGLAESDRVRLTPAVCGQSGSDVHSDRLVETARLRTEPGGIVGTTGDGTTSRLFALNWFHEFDFEPLRLNVCWCSGSTGCADHSVFSSHLTSLLVNPA